MLFIVLVLLGLVRILPALEATLDDVCSLLRRPIVGSSPFCKAFWPCGMMSDHSVDPSLADALFFCGASDTKALFMAFKTLVRILKFASVMGCGT